MRKSEPKVKEQWYLKIRLEAEVSGEGLVWGMLVSITEKNQGECPMKVVFNGDRYS